MLSQKSLTNKISHLKQQSYKSTEIVFFLSDPFTEYYYPDSGLAAVQVMIAAGCKVVRLPVLGSGRTLISKGFLDHAKSHAQRFINIINKLDPQGEINIVGVEPSEIYTLRDEFLDLLPRNKDTYALASRAYMVDEFLIRPDHRGIIRVDKILESKITSGEPMETLLHGHCYQKSQPPATDGLPIGVQATRALLEKANISVKLIEVVVDGWCIGYEWALNFMKIGS
jgi:Fe-S oxidoreductase